jgi:molecular chaperone DnaK
MEQTINLGIDLGTTNSAICYFDKGEIKIFKDPITWKDTIPSVVSFRKDRIIVGQKAKEYMEKSPQNTIGAFKRKMGTNETFKIKSLDITVSPIELSSYVLKELKTFIQDKNIPLDAAVITIPASFDTIQSNATKQAGQMAGFKEIVLLQEPIAASLAYANSKNRNLENTKWLVYDLGGGTFDVALLHIEDGEMKVLDHEGDNFLGGSDFDRLIIEKIIIPYLETNYNFSNLKNELQNSNGKYNKLYYKLLYLAEQAKIQLSTRTSADIEFEIDDKDIYFIITRDEFEKIIKNDIIKTIDMIKKILVSNSLRNDDIDFILMIGGSTYIPFIRKYVEDVLQIKVVNDIDPTTAVAIGAAYYAGNKKKNSLEKDSSKDNKKFKIKMAYEKSTQDDTGYVAAKIDGNVSDFYYKIRRKDGGFDSGLKTLTNRISEELPLVKNSYNFFELLIYDQFNNTIQTESIEISQGKYTIAGQPLPEDISLEVDDYNQGKTKLELIFKKNTILPIKKSITKEINKTIKVGSKDSIIINVLEGDGDSIPEANKTLGFIKISGNDINRDILKGSDIELTFKISESRDLTVSAYITMTNQEFKEIFNPKSRNVDIINLINEIKILSESINESLNFAKENNDYEKIEILYSLKSEIDNLQKDVNELNEHDTTDKRYQLEDIKREIAQCYFKTIKDEKINKIKKEYLDLKPEVERLVAQYANYTEQEYFREIIEKEKIYLNSNNFSKIEELLEELRYLEFQMHWKEPDFVKGAFAWLIETNPNFNDPSRANLLIGKGFKYLEQENIEELSNITRELLSILSREDKEKAENKIGFY